MKRIFSFLCLLMLMYGTIELLNGEDLSMTSQDLTYNFTPDALASLDKGNEGQPNVGASNIDPTTLVLLGSGLIGLAGFWRKGAK